uniref:Kinesin 9A protein n=1 Tax=Marsilea vestita TaxID=59764 RepID=A0A142KWB2_MARVE|nr:kinesin 9A protein [Marsilea vestita]
MGYYRIASHLRLKPSARPSPALHVDAPNSSLRVDLKHSAGGPPRSHGDQIVFHLDSVIQSTSQESTFNRCALKIVEDVLCGYNGTVLAYGQSGSGKSYTMSGDPKNSMHKGIVPRAIQRIFAEKAARPESEMAIHVSYLEIYNEVIYDLLSDGSQASRVVTLLEENSLLEMKGLSQFHCSTEEEALKYFLRGERHRTIAPNMHHKMSNRSHCMFTIYVERHTKVRDYPDRTAAKLNLVDLAGCERLKNANSVKQWEKEISNINKSLTFLEQAVADLRRGQGHVSFRQSRLTMLLKDALGGNSRTVLIVCALQEHDSLDETISALRFAQRVKDLKTSAVINKVVDSALAERQKYERKIAELKKELSLHDALNGRVGISRDEISEQRRVDLKTKIEDFLREKADVDVIPIESLAQIKETFYLFKEAQAHLHAQMEKQLNEDGLAKAHENESNEIDDNDGVGELEAEGFYVGVAPLDARPEKTETQMGGSANFVPTVESFDEKNTNVGVGDEKKRNAAFLDFKHNTSEGTQICYVLKAKKAELKEKRLAVQTLHDRMKDCKRQIHDINCLLMTDSQIDSAQDQSDVELSNKLHEQEQLKQRMETAKEDYQRLVTEITEKKSEIKLLKKEIMDYQETLLDSFFTWYKEAEGNI